MRKVELFKSAEIKPKEDSVCFVCGELLESVNPISKTYTNLLINYKPVCSWKCFSKYVAEHTKKKEEIGDEKPKRGRPRKNK